MAQFVINVPELEGKGRQSLAWPVTKAWLEEAMADIDLDAAKDADGELTVEAHKVGDDVLVEAHVVTKVLAPCARCNEPTEVPVSTDFTQLFQHRGSAQMPLPEELELTPEDLERDTYEGDEIALDPLVREFIILEIPMSPRCEGGCADPDVNRILGGTAGNPEGPLAALLKLKVEEPD